VTLGPTLDMDADFATVDWNGGVPLGSRNRRACLCCRLLSCTGFRAGNGYRRCPHRHRCRGVRAKSLADGRECQDNVAPDAYSSVTGNDFPLDDSDLSGRPCGTSFNDNDEAGLARRYPRLAARFR
jgi:hypothetical protein